MKKTSRQKLNVQSYVFQRTGKSTSEFYRLLFFISLNVSLITNP